MAATISYIVNGDTITAWLSNLDTSWNLAERTATWTLNGGDIRTETIANKAETSNGVSWDNLAKGSYKIKCVVTAKSTQCPEEGWGFGPETIVIKGKKPQKFSWENKKTTGGTYNLTASEWNGLKNKIIEVAAYNDQKVSSMTEVLPGDSLTIEIWNEIVRGIEECGGTVQCRKTESDRGTPVKASELNDLQDTINSVISNLT